jgi:hypothetical protein
VKPFYSCPFSELLVVVLGELRFRPVTCNGTRKTGSIDGSTRGIDIYPHGLTGSWILKHAKNFGVSSLLALRDRAVGNPVLFTGQ